MIKTKKRKKSGRHMGTRTHTHGAMKRGSGHRGGVGMAGSGKRADHKKSLILVKFKKYFGKQGETSKGTERRKLKTINLREISQNFDSLMKKFGKGSELILKNYKILGEGELKEKITIKAHAVTTKAKEKIEKAGGKVILPVKKEFNDKVSNDKKDEKVVSKKKSK